MKKIVVMMFLTVITVISYAQQTPVVNQRQRNQQARIREGVVSGDLTRTETKRLRVEQRHIRRTERRVKADGTVTPTERRKLERKQNRASRDIRRQKHDGQ